MKFAPGLKLTLHNEYIKYLEGEFVYPINIEISPSGKCNAGCKTCFYKNNQSGEFIDFDIIKNLLKNIKAKAISWTGGGEPTLHVQFKNMILYVPKNIKQGLFTNGLSKVKYNPEIFEWIRITKTDRDWNVENIKLLSEYKNIGLCINDTGDEYDILNALDIVYKYNLNYVQVRPALSTKGKKTNIAKPKLKDKKLILIDYKYKGARINKVYTRCEGYHFVPFIWENGDVTTCAYHSANDYSKLGNIYYEDFEKIMKKAPEFRIVKSDCQICCKNNEINELIFGSKQVEHKEFV